MTEHITQSQDYLTNRCNNIQREIDAVDEYIYKYGSDQRITHRQHKLRKELQHLTTAQLALKMVNDIQFLVTNIPDDDEYYNNHIGRGVRDIVNVFNKSVDEYSTKSQRRSD